MTELSGRLFNAEREFMIAENERKFTTVGQAKTDPLRWTDEKVADLFTITAKVTRPEPIEGALAGGTLASVNLGVTCITNDAFKGLTEDVNKALATNNGTPKVPPLKIALERLVGDARPIPNTQSVCVPSEQLQALKTQLGVLQLLNTLHQIDEIKVSKGLSADSTRYGTNVDSLTSKSTVASTPALPLQSSSPVRTLPNGFLKRILAQACPVYPLC